MNILYYANAEKIARCALTDETGYTIAGMHGAYIMAYSSVINESYLFVLPWPPRLIFNN